MRVSKHLKLNKKQQRIVKIAEKCYDLTDDRLIEASDNYHDEVVLLDLKRQMESRKKVAV